MISEIKEVGLTFMHTRTIAMHLEMEWILTILRDLISKNPFCIKSSDIF